MADDTSMTPPPGFTPIPDDPGKSRRTPPPGFTPIAKPLGGADTGGEVTHTPGWGEYLEGGAKTVAQHIPVQAAQLAPIGAGAAMGGALAGPPGAVVGASIGGFASPAAEYGANKAVGLPAQPPTMGQAAQSAAVGAGSEMAAPITEPILQFGGKLWRAVTGATEIGEAATEAGAKTEAANVAEREKLQGKAAAEAAGQKKDTLEAAKKAREQQVADIEQRHANIQAAQERVKQTDAQAHIDSEKAVAKAKEKLTKEAEPAARQEVLEGTLHPPGEQPLAAGPERIQRGEQFRDTIVSRLQRYRNDWAARRDKALEKFGDNPLDGQPLQEEVATEQSKWPPGHAPYSPRIQKLFSKVQGLFEADPEAVAAAQTNVEMTSPSGFKVSATGSMAPMFGQLSRMPPEQLESLLADTEKRFGPAARAEMEAGLRQQSIVPHQPTVKEYLGLQSEANAIARASKGADRTAALRVVHGVDKTLLQVDTGELKALNAEYTDHRLHFPYDFEDAIRTAPNPLAAAKDIFSQPERVLDLAKFGTLEENSQLAQHYSDYIRAKGDPVMDPQVFRALGFKGPMADPKSWIYADKAVDRVGEMFDSAPTAKAIFDRRLAVAERDAKDEAAKDILKAARDDLGKMGLTGLKIQGQIDAAPNLVMKATAAVKAMSNLDPASEAVKGVTSEQGNVMAMAGQGAAGAAPRDARQALAGFQPADPHQAAVEAVTGFKPGSGSFKDRWRRRAEFWLPLAGAGMMVGRPSGYAQFGLALGGPIAVREAIAYGYRESLRSPEAANAFLYALKNPGTKKGLELMTKYIAQAAIFKNAPRDESAPLPPKSAKVAGVLPAPPVKPEARADLRKDIAKGKTPDVTRDLHHGKLKPRDIRAELERAPGDMG